MVRPIKILDFDIYKSFADQAKKEGLKEMGLYSTGEPLMVKNLEKYIKYAKKIGIEYVYITTNASLLNDKKFISLINAGLDSIKFSVNGGSKETYKLIHGKDDFETVLSNIKNISLYRKRKKIKLKLLVSFVVTKYTINEKQKVIDIFKEYVDDILFNEANSQMGRNLEFLKDFSVNPDDYKIKKPKSASPCHMLWNRLHVTCEGYLNLCCNDYENTLTYADLREVSLVKAWHNSIIEEMRKKHKSKNIENTLCQNCLYNTAFEYEPISNIGYYENKSYKSNKKSGVESIKRRISFLEKNL